MNGLSGYAGEVCFHEELQQLASVDGTHCLTQTLPSQKKVLGTLAASTHKGMPTLYLVSWTEGLLHGMQTISHGVNSIDDEAHLGVLCILMAQRLSPCEGHVPV